MNISCKIINDLLPLYKDGVCSEESKKIIEEHILECTECKLVLKNMQADISMAERKANLKEAEAIQKLSKKWNKKLFLSMIKGILLTLMVLGLIALFVYIFVGIKTI